MVKLTPTGVKINTKLVWTSHNTGGVEFNTGVFAVWMVPFFQKQEIIKKIGFSLKPDDVIVMSSNVHEWKGKPNPLYDFNV